MDLILLLGAESDLQGAFNRLEDVQEGRGLLFLRSVEAALGLLRQHPQAGPHYDGTYRRLLLPRFPFGLFYELQPQRIIVIAIMDLRQSPQSIRSRLFGHP